MPESSAAPRIELVGPEEEWEFHKAVGCELCGGTGYWGRIGIYEMMTMTPGLRRLIQADTDLSALKINVVSTQGMV